MKNLLLSTILILFVFNLTAQEENSTPTDKGRFIADGSVYFSINNSKSTDTNFESKADVFGFGISPKAGYFIINRLALGLETSYNYTENKFDDNNGTKNLNISRSFAIGPFAKYYLPSGFFGQASIGFGRATSESSGYKNRSNSFRYQVGVGYAIFIGNQLSLEPLINYQYNKLTNDNSSAEFTNNGFTLGIGFTIFL